MSASNASTADARAFIASGQPAQLHRAWDLSNCDYDPVHDQYVPSKPQSIRTIAAPPTEHFFKVMTAFQNNYPQDESISNFNIRDSHSWEEVLFVAGAAQERYQSKGQGFRGIFHKIGRKTGDMNPAIDSFLGLLPSGEYTSIVCGGIILIFRTFKKMSEVRQKVMRALGDTPQLLEQVENFVRIYPEDTKLNERAIKLYIALLATIEGIITWFDHGAWERLKVFMQQGLYARKLDDKIDFLNTCAQNLRERADLCDKEMTVEISQAINLSLSKIDSLQDLIISKGEEGLAATNDLANQVGGAFNKTNDSIEGVSRKLSDRFGDMKTDIDDSFEGISQQVGGMSNQIDTGFDDVSHQIGGVTRQVDSGLDRVREAQDASISRLERSMIDKLNSIAANQLVRQLSSDEKKFEWQTKQAMEEARLARERAAFLEQQLQVKSLELERALTPSQTLVQGEVLRLLGRIVGASDTDAEQYVRMARALDSSPELTDMIMSTPKFATWFASAKSQMLFIDPNTPLGRVSAGSFVTASLAQVLATMAPAIALKHFGRGQATQDADFDSASTLLASLLSQLLTTREYDLRTWTQVTSLRDHYEALTTRDINYLCSFFKHLVTSLPYGTIFVLLDDFFELERTADPQNLHATIRCLSETVQTCIYNDAVVFKVLFVTPDPRGNVLRFVNQEDVLRLRPSGPRGIDSRSWAGTPKQQRFQMESATRKRGGGSRY